MAGGRGGLHAATVAAGVVRNLVGRSEDATEVGRVKILTTYAFDVNLEPERMLSKTVLDRPKPWTSTIWGWLLSLQSQLG